MTWIHVLRVQFFICSMSFATFAVHFEKSQNRLQLTFILLLTTITFKFAVNQSLPRISYLTYLVRIFLSFHSIKYCSRLETNTCNALAVNFTNNGIVHFM